MFMRVLFVFHSLAQWGGIERIIVDKLNYFASVLGYEVFMLTTDQGTNSQPFQFVNGVHYKDLNIRFYLRYRFKGIERLRKTFQLKSRFRRLLSEQLQIIQPNVIVCTTSTYIDLEIIAELKGNIPLVVESHSICQRTLGQGGLFHFYKDYCYRKALRKADVVVALTKHDAIDWRKHRLKIGVIPNIIHQDQGPCSDLCQPHVIFVGRFDYQKRPMIMIHIWQRIFLNFPDWHLDMYGDGDQSEEIKTMVNALGNNIHVYPPTAHIFDCYRRSSILVSTSLFEPFGLVIPEAMSCGLPVVAFDCPYGPSEIVTDGVDGFLVKDDDMIAFVDRLSKLMSDKSLRLLMGQSAFKTAQRYSAENIMPKWQTLFESLIK